MVVPVFLWSARMATRSVGLTSVCRSRAVCFLVRLTNRKAPAAAARCSSVCVRCVCVCAARAVAFAAQPGRQSGQSALDRLGRTAQPAGGRRPCRGPGGHRRHGRGRRRRRGGGGGRTTGGCVHQGATSRLLLRHGHQRRRARGLYDRLGWLAGCQPAIAKVHYNQGQQ